MESALDKDFEQELDGDVWRVSYRVSGDLSSPEAGEFLTSVSSGLVDKDILSYGRFRPTLVYNDPSRGVTVLSRIIDELRQLVAGDEFWFTVAFVKHSGMELLLQTFDELGRKGVKGRILTGTYLTFSEPRAFKDLMRYPNIETHVYNAEYVGLHAKSYFFRHGGVTDLLTGSSNLTDSALNSNKEWNLAISSLEQGALVRDATEAFEQLWNSPESYELTEGFLADYTERYERNLQRQVIPIDETTADSVIEPNAMQKEALGSLAKCRADGEPRALVISATGTGKTYLAALDVRQASPRPTKVLFVVHRERIAQAALVSFKRVLGDRYTYGLYAGGRKDASATCLFSTVQTLSREENLEAFSPDEFDYIIVDEVHRAGAPSYQRVINHFNPAFLLGMSATPERNDGFDVFELFNHVVAYEIRLQGALDNHLVAPFHYFGVADGSDEIGTACIHEDYDSLTDRILFESDKYAYSGPRLKALVFCSHTSEAEGIASAMCERGFSAEALTGSSSDAERESAMTRLEQDEGDDSLDYIVTVDVFNEGVDIPTINQVIMVRPTDSAIIFVQQLGRGLRINPQKQYVNVIDFVSNYDKNYNIPVALNGDRSFEKESLRRLMSADGAFAPGTTTFQFDEIARERVLRSINKANFNSIRFVGQAYHALRQRLGRIPSLEDFRQFGEASPDLIFSCKSLGSYHAYLSRYEPEYHVEFSDDQETILKFLSSCLADGKRATELLVVRELLSGGTTIDEAREKVDAYDLLHAGRLSPAMLTADMASSLRVLSLSFFNSVDRGKFVPLCEPIMGDGIVPSRELCAALADPEFVRQCREVVDYGLHTNELRYEGSAPDSRLCVGERYTRADACRLLDWDKDEHGTINGYSFKTDDWLIFVTYHKGADVSDSIRYKDEFLSPSTFVWYSQNNRGLKSKDYLKLCHLDPDETRVHLFVKRDDSEGSDHYYLGTLSFDPRMIAEEKTVDAHGAEVPILRVPFSLDREVAPETYRYLTS